MASAIHATADRIGAALPARKAGRAVAIGATALAAAALANVARARWSERDHPPMGRFLEIEGSRVHYLERGDGPPVVLLHGNVVSADDYVWSGVLDAAARHHRVVAFDRPGYGYSDRPSGKLWTPAAQARHLRQAFAKLGLERPVVVGHSWGTLVALSLALDHPDAVGGLVLMSGYYRPTARVDVPLPAAAAIPVLGDLLRYTVSPLFGTATLPLTLKAMFAPLAVPEAFRQNFAYGFPVRPSQIRAEGQDAATMVPGAAGLKARYGELNLPITIMAGTEDRIVDMDHQSAWFHDAIAGSELRLIPGVGHMLHHAVPEQVVDAIATVIHRPHQGDRSSGHSRGHLLATVASRPAA